MELDEITIDRTSFLPAATIRNSYETVLESGASSSVAFDSLTKDATFVKTRIFLTILKYIQIEMEETR